LPDTNNYIYSPFNSKVISLPSMIVPKPCQAYVLREQVSNFTDVIPSLFEMNNKVIITDDLMGCILG
jgi:hypothetical protein